MLADLPGPLGIVCHDAGGANQIFAALEPGAHLLVNDGRVGDEPPDRDDRGQSRKDCEQTVKRHAGGDQAKIPAVDLLGNVARRCQPGAGRMFEESGHGTSEGCPAQA